MNKCINLLNEFKISIKKQKEIEERIKSEKCAHDFVNELFE